MKKRETERPRVSIAVRQAFARAGTLVRARWRSARSALLRRPRGASRHEVEALRRDALCLRRVTERLPALVWTTDASLRITSLCGALLPSVGLEAEATLGHDAAELLAGSASDREQAVRAHQQALAGERAEYVQSREGHLLRVRLEPFRDLEGTQAVLGLAVDITEKLEVLRQLQQSRAVLAAVLESSSESIWVLDPDGRVTAANGAFYQRLERLLGLTLKPGDDFFPTMAQRVPERAHQLSLLYERALQGEVIHDERHFEDAKGEHVFDISLSPIRTEEGFRGVAGFSKEMTGWHQAQERLRQSEERFSAIFHASPVPILVTAVRDGRVVDMNEACERLVDLPRAQLVGRTTGELSAWIRPEDRAEILKELAHSPAVLNREVRIRRREGTLDLISSFARMHLGGEECLLTISFDVTESRRTARLLRQSEARFSAIFHTSPASIVVTARDDGRILDMNESAEKLFALKREEALGRTTLELGLWADPEDRLRMLDQMKCNGAMERMAMEYRPRDGQPRSALLSACAIELDGQPCVVSICEDVTERNRLMDELTRAKNRFARVFEACPAPMLVTRFPSGELVTLNGAARAAYGLGEEALGRTTVELGVWLKLEERARFIDEARSHDSVHGFECDHRDGQGRTRRKVLSATRIELDGQQCLLSISEDITEQRLLEERLRDATKMEAVGQLAGGVAHDFNNLLTVISGYAEMLRRELGGSQRQQHLVEQIQKSARRASELTRQLLAFGRKQVMQPAVLDLNEVVREAVGRARQLVGEKIEVVTALSPELGQVKVDREQLGQALLNLVVNARDAMPRGGRLVIDTGNVELEAQALRGEVPPGAYVLLSVSDTGMGMDESTRKHVFEPFFTTKAQGEGTGLGLSSVYGIVQQSEGYIAVESAPGRGATFQIYLPRVDRTERKAVAGRAVGQESGRRETVLLVEDEDDVRELIEEVLQELGYRVVAVGDGAEAVRVAQESEQPIDVLLTDVVMPRMHGPEVATRVRELRPGTRVLYMSGYPGESVARMAQLDARTGFLQKPFSVEALAERLQAVVQGGTEAHAT